MEDKKFTTIDECWEKIITMKKLIEEFKSLMDIQFPIEDFESRQFIYDAIYNLHTQLMVLAGRVDELETELERYEEATLPPIPTINITVKPDRCPYWDYEKHDLSTFNGHDCNCCNCRTEGNTYKNAKYGVMINGDRYCTLSNNINILAVKEFCKDDITSTTYKRAEQGKVETVLL